MIKAIISGVFKLIISLVSLILSPIDALITQFLPGLDTALTYISNFFDYIGGIVPWVISYTGINEVVLNAIIDIFVFILSVPLMVHTIKLAVAWYNKLKI